MEVNGRSMLVTGGTGFIGSHLANHLLSLASRVRCLVRHKSSCAYLPSGIEIVHGDVVTGAGLREALAGIEVVFHLAGVTKANSRKDFYSGNVVGTQNLLHACESSATAPPRFIHVSSLAAIGPSPNGAPLSEDVEPHPLTDYGKSKLQAEDAVRRSSVSSNAVIVRPPVVFGPRDTDVLQVFRAIRRGVFLRISGLEQLFSVIYVKDLVQGLIAAARRGKQGRAYFLANQEPVSWSEFGALAADLMARRLRVVRVPMSAAFALGFLAEIASRIRRKPGILSRDKIMEAGCRFWICDVSRAQTELGFHSQTSLRDAMAETLAWYEEAGWLKL